MNQEPEIKLATEADMALITELLQANSLPYSDLMTSEITFLMAADGQQLKGCIGLEVMGEVGLLRSFAVETAYKNQGIGKTLFNSLIQYAKQLGIAELYLLTTTAAGYFEKQKFGKIDRNLVPLAIKNTAEFAGICPASATVMRLDVGLS